MTTDFQFTVAAKNGKDTRLVVARFGEQEYRDKFNTDSSQSREKFLRKLAEKSGDDATEIIKQHEAQLAQLADAADLEATEAIEAEFAPRPVKAISTKAVLLPGESATITATAAELGKRLAGTGKHYTRGGVSIRAVVVDGEVRLEPIKAAAACSEFETVASLTRMKATKDGAVEVGAVCSEATAKLIIESQAFRNALPTITVLSRCPVLIERGGKLETITGHDRDSGIMAMGAKPLDMNLDQAKELLNLVLKDFHFASEGDKSRALAAFITPGLVFGGLLGGRSPIDVGEADQSQAGKGYRHKITTAFYRNQPRTITQRERGVGSMQETFDAVLVSGACFPSFDNLRGKIESAGIESYMTEDVYLARIPYSGPMEIDATRTVVMLTTNKGEFTRDMTNRQSIVRIWKRPDGYQYQTFPEGDLLNHIQANQAKFLGAVFAVIREWHKQGKPRLDNAPHDFRRWATTLGWIVENLLGEAPLVEGHRAIQERMSSPAGNWLRDLALAVRAAGKMGERLRANKLLETVLEAGIKTAGVAEDIDLADDAAFRKGSQAIGMQMSRAFKGDKITADDITIIRFESEDDKGRPVKEYQFLQATPPPELLEVPEVKSLFPEPPEVLQTFPSGPLNSSNIESVAEVREVREISDNNFVSPYVATVPEVSADFVGSSGVAEGSGVPKCNHISPEKWTHREGVAYCPGCDKRMGYVAKAGGQ